MPQHVVLLHKIELGYVWPYINFCIQLLNNTTECLASGIKLACLWWTGLTRSLETNGNVM